MNQFGLGRDIPNPIKRLVRQRCGFGCVVCGGAFYQYEHIDPEFAEAQEHDPNRIALLCGGCHDRVTRGVLSKDTVKNCLRQPKCRELGFSFGPFDIGPGFPEIVIGTFTGRMTGALIEINGEKVFSISPPETDRAPFRIYASLRDREGNDILGIEDNEWKTPTTNWDVEVVGRRITVRSGARDISLILRSDPPGRIIVERLEMEHRGTRIHCSEKKPIEVTTPSGIKMYSEGATVEKCTTGIRVTDAQLEVGVGGTIKFAGQTTVLGPKGQPLLIVSGGFMAGSESAISIEVKQSKQPSVGSQALPPTAHPFPKHKIGRNDPCPCGSGKKYKRCHGT
jgi:hypothetical protein